ncbi:MAG TPA: hypothetical protein VEX86_12515 [Longimicrobium sp.]|nr:hypothetical protein [Longimicrobium sp.]
MTLAQFSIAVGAEPKWVQNAIAALGLPASYDETRARRLGLARVLNATAGMPLKRAFDLAGKALAPDADPIVLVAEAKDGSAQVRVDVQRYLSTFLARLSAAGRYTSQQTGRPARTTDDPVTVAREYGIDISLLQSNLLRTPEERLRIAGQNAEFIGRIRGRAGR